MSKCNRILVYRREIVRIISIVKRGSNRRSRILDLNCAELRPCEDQKKNETMLRSFQSTRNYRDIGRGRACSITCVYPHVHNAPRRVDHRRPMVSFSIGRSLITRL